MFTWLGYIEQAIIAGTRNTGDCKSTRKNGWKSWWKKIPAWKRWMPYLVEPHW